VFFGGGGGGGVGGLGGVFLLVGGFGGGVGGGCWRLWRFCWLGGEADLVGFVLWVWALCGGGWGRGGLCWVCGVWGEGVWFLGGVVGRVCVGCGVGSWVWGVFGFVGRWGFGGVCVWRCVVFCEDDKDFFCGGCGGGLGFCWFVGGVVLFFGGEGFCVCGVGGVVFGCWWFSFLLGKCVLCCWGGVWGGCFVL